MAQDGEGLSCVDVNEVMAVRLLWNLSFLFNTDRVSFRWLETGRYGSMLRHVSIPTVFHLIDPPPATSLGVQLEYGRYLKIWNLNKIISNLDCVLVVIFSNLCDRVNRKRVADWKNQAQTDCRERFSYQPGHLGPGKWWCSSVIPINIYSFFA